MPAVQLYLRLSGFYLIYFATLGAILPYWGLYLQSLGFEAAQIGALIAITLITKLVAPNVWGWIADHSGRRMRIVRLACLAAAVTFAGVYTTHSFSGLAMVMLLFSFFWNAALPQFEATTLSHLGEHSHRYSSIRLWGSVGFIITVVGIGALLQHLAISILPAVILGLFVTLWLVSLIVPERTAGHLQLDNEPLSRVLRRPYIVALLLVCFLNQASHGPYYAFFSIYLQGLGYTRGLIGTLWGLGVVAEAGVFLIMHRWLPRYGARRLMLATLALTSLRWLLIADFADNLPMLLVAQTLHAFSFGVYHAVAIHLIHGCFTGQHQGRGQALYSSLSFGAGGALGSFAAGHLWAEWGAEPTYLMAALLSAVGLVVAWYGLRC